MTRFITKRSRAVVAVASLSVFAALGAILVLAGSSAAATPTTVNLATAGNFAVLAGTGISDVPTSAITGNVGLSPHPGTDITGLTCAEVHGTIYTTNNAGPPCHNFNLGLVNTAKNDLTNAYNDAAGRIVPPLNALGAGDKQLDGLTLVAGVYSFGHAATANLTTTLTLNGSASSVWIFQASSDLVFGSGSSVHMTGGASACNVFWQVSSSATLGTSSTVKGTILALTSITANNGSTINGRLLARNGLVSLDSNTIARSACAASGGSSGQPPARALYCDATGKTYDLVAGEDKQPPYDALNLVPAYVNPVTGSQSCDFPAVATTPAATTTTTVTAPPPPVTTTRSAPKPPSARKTKGGVKAAKLIRAAHVAPKPARHQGGFTG
jgi:Ice-binding-like